MRLIIFLALAGLISCGHKGTKNEVAVETPVSYTKASQMPVEEFFRNPVLFGYRVSPDGQTMALLKPWKNRLNVFVHPSGHPENQRQLTYSEDRDIGGLTWKNSTHVLFSKDQGGDENMHVYSVNVANGVVKDLTPQAGARSNIIDTLDESTGSEILVANNRRNKELFDVYRINVETGAERLEHENTEKMTGWLVDHDGQLRGGTANDGVTSVVYFEKAKGQPFEPIFKTDFRNSFEPLTFTADNKHIYISTNVNRNLTAIVEVDPTLPSKSWVKKTIYSHPKYDVSGATYSPVHKALGQVVVITDRRETHFLNPADEKDWKLLRSKFPKESIDFANDTKDESIWVVKTQADVSKGAYYSFDRKTKAVTKLGDVAPWINPALMSPTKTIHYKTRDGLTIEGYLTIPSGSNGKKLPMVVNPHGGPWARDEWRFNPEVQFLASRGYAVFQMNFRGSTGYGKKFWEASFKQWGKKMQNDITDGVKHLIKKGVADAKKVCIYGGSYGGYATLAGITFTPDLYACAIDYVGVSNLLTFMNTIPPYWKPYMDMMHVMVGDPAKEKALLESASPVNFVDKIKTPLFVAQGKNDPRVNKAESDQIVEGLHKRGIDVEYMVKDNEGHGFHNEENRFDFYRAMEKFLAKHIGTAVTAAN
jgi:dipeptidyl aminopeptidase/acylaminoacyl peptidase